ncbi:hypothetical protein Lser_V15G03438 [Lactuca serriola]
MDSQQRHCSSASPSSASLTPEFTIDCETRVVGHLEAALGGDGRSKVGGCRYEGECTRSEGKCFRSEGGGSESEDCCIPATTTVSAVVPALVVVVGSGRSYNMSNISKLGFAALEVSGKNYVPWMIDVKMHLESMGISNAINEFNNCLAQDKARAQVFLRKHIDEMLRFEYLDVTDPSILWNLLKERFDHQKEVILPNARDEWRTLRFQDFKKVNEYNSALFRICLQLKYCGQEVTDEDMLEKTYSTFHATNITLMQQYRMQKFTRYFELNACLLVAEQNNELLMKNHESRPTGSVALPKANATNINGYQNNTRGRGCGYFNRNQSHNQNHNFGRGQGNNRVRGHKKNNYQSSQRNNVHTQDKAKVARCGSTGHWSRTCRTPAHLCQLYQESIKGKGKEANLDDNVEFAPLTFDEFYNEMEDIN